MPSNDSNYGDFTTTARLPGARHVLKKRGSSAVECRTRNQESLGWNPICYRFEV